MSFMYEYVPLSTKYLLVVVSFSFGNDSTVDTLTVLIHL